MNKNDKFKIKIAKPSAIEVNKYLTQWDSLDNYTAQESSLKKLFTVTYPNNKDLDDILIKVCTLNTFYSTNIYSPYKVANHILSLDIDKHLESGDLNIVNKVAKVQMNQDKEMNFYSFATKYCSHHKPTIYPIYDFYVEEALIYFRHHDSFAEFQDEDLKNYSEYKNILTEFCNYYKLSVFDLKKIDKYLWQLGKEYFPKKYKK